MKKTYADSENVKVVTPEKHNEERVGEQPRDDEASSERLVPVLDVNCLDLLLLHVRLEGTLDCGLKLAINVLLRFINLVECLFALVRLDDRCRWHLVCFVGSLGTPGNVVPVVECVHHEDVDVGRHEE